MLKIRLSRIGKNQYATFRIVIAEQARAVKGGALEILGSYDPHTDDIRINAERVKYWLQQGAHVSPTVHNLLIDEKILEGQKVTAWKPPRKKAEGSAAKDAETATSKSTETPSVPETPQEG